MTENNSTPSQNEKPSQMTDKQKQMLKYTVPVAVVVILLIIVSIFTGAFSGGNKPDNKTNSSSANGSSKSLDVNATDVGGQKFEAKPSNKEDEKLSQALNANLQFKRKNGGTEYNWDMGWLDVQSMKACSTKFGATKIPNVKDIGYADAPKNLLRDIVPVPAKAEKKNTVVYGDYNVEVPLIYTNVEDMFDTEKDGKINFNKKINDNDVNSPLQTKLKDGAILLPISPLPGEIGNSYISAHTSNYSFVDSNYNKAFKPLEGKGKVGEIFYVYDCEGRKLPFKVFEAKEYIDNANLLWTNSTKREVTLQGSVLKNCNKELEQECINRGCAMNTLCPTHRWIIKGELQLEEAKKINSAK